MSFPISRRRLLATTATATIGAPAILRAQTREILVRGAAPDTTWMKTRFIPPFEQKYNAKVLYEGAIATINLEKLRSEKAKPQTSVVLLGESEMGTAKKEGLLLDLSSFKVPNLAELRPNYVRGSGWWCYTRRQWIGIAVNVNENNLSEVSWADLWDPKYKSAVALPSIQNADSPAWLTMSAVLETNKPISQGLYDTDAAFRKLASLKPNLLNVYTNLPQAFNLLEQGEAKLFVTFSSYVATRRAGGSPVKIIVPKEGAFELTQTIGLVANGPAPELGALFINELLEAGFQQWLVSADGSVPANKHAATAPGAPKDEQVHPIDWPYFQANRPEMLKRWDREMRL
ncbi:MAG: extracellular solute-binding protein [Hyphomicrobiaceae bacterium]